MAFGRGCDGRSVEYIRGNRKVWDGTFRIRRLLLTKCEVPTTYMAEQQELIFPHHEAELAQDEAISGKIPFVKIWMHTGLIFMKEKEKMSKSLGNVVMIKEALKTFSADEIRFHFLKYHYRVQFEHNSDSLSASKAEFGVIKEAAAAVPRSDSRTNSLRNLRRSRCRKRERSLPQGWTTT